MKESSQQAVVTGSCYLASSDEPATNDGRPLRECAECHQLKMPDRPHDMTSGHRLMGHSQIKLVQISVSKHTLQG